MAIVLSLSALCLATTAVQVWAQNKTVPSTGSGTAGPTSTEWDTKWNLFAWRGKSTNEISDKINREYARFIGKTWSDFPGGNDTERFLSDYPGRNDMMYSKWGGGQHGRVTIEAQCYSMMIAAQMDDRDTFDKLWRFTKTFMQQGSRNDSGGPRCFFGWEIYLNADGTVDPSTRNNGPASDGEQWITAALYIASGRWGDSGAFNYRRDADDIAECMLHLDEYNNNPSDGWSSLFTPDDGSARGNQVKFSPFDDIEFTDPTYHLPVFYGLFARCGPVADRARWNAIALKSRTYLLPRACGFDVDGTHPNNTGNTWDFPNLLPDEPWNLYRSFTSAKMENGVTKLPPGYTSWDGKAYHHVREPKMGMAYRGESWRVAQNIGSDYMWWGDSGDTQFQYHSQIVGGIQNFLGSRVPWQVSTQQFGYESERTLNGVPLYNGGQDSPAGNHGAGVAACNAVASLCSSSEYADEFVDELWAREQPSNDRYNQYLYMTSLLQCSGRFRVYLPGGEGGNTDSPSFSLSNSLSPGTTVTVNSTATARTVFTNTGGAMNGGQLGFRLFNDAWALVNEYTEYSVSIPSSQSRTVSWDFTTPDTPGTYKLYAGAWDTSWNSYLWTETSTVTVTAASTQPTFHVNSSGIPSGSLAPGSVFAINGYFNCTAGSMTNGKTGLRLITPGGSVIEGPTDHEVNMTAHQSRGMTWNLTAPTPAGQYTVIGAAWDSAWNNYAWQSLGTFTVTASPGMEVFGSPVYVDGSGMHNFGNVKWSGTASVSKTFSIRNKGNQTLNFTGSPRVRVTGTNVGNFAVTSQIPVASLAPGATTTFTVKFDPSASGVRNATVNITSNDPATSPYTFSLRGTGTN